MFRRRIRRRRCQRLPGAPRLPPPPVATAAVPSPPSPPPPCAPPRSAWPPPASPPSHRRARSVSAVTRPPPPSKMRRVTPPRPTSIALRSPWSHPRRASFHVARQRPLRAAGLRARSTVAEGRPCPCPPPSASLPLPCASRPPACRRFVAPPPSPAAACARCRAAAPPAPPPPSPPPRRRSARRRGDHRRASSPSPPSHRARFDRSQTSRRSLAAAVARSSGARLLEGLRLGGRDAEARVVASSRRSARRLDHPALQDEWVAATQ